MSRVSHVLVLTLLIGMTVFMVAVPNIRPTHAVGPPPADPYTNLLKSACQTSLGSSGHNVSMPYSADYWSCSSGDLMVSVGDLAVIVMGTTSPNREGGYPQVSVTGITNSSFGSFTKEVNQTNGNSGTVGPAGYYLNQEYESEWYKLSTVSGKLVPTVTFDTPASVPATFTSYYEMFIFYGPYHAGGIASITGVQRLLDQQSGLTPGTSVNVMDGGLDSFSLGNHLVVAGLQWSGDEPVNESNPTQHILTYSSDSSLGCAGTSSSPTECYDATTSLGVGNFFGGVGMAVDGMTSPTFGYNVTAVIGGIGVSAAAVLGDYLFEPADVNVTVTTSPSPLTDGIKVDGTLYTSPQSFTWTWGTQHNITAATTVGAYTFASWSDEGARSHLVTPSMDITYTAAFTLVSAITVTVNTNPSGIINGIIVDGTYYSTEQTFEWIPGDSHNITASASALGPSGNLYTFVSWSDAGARSHLITVPSNATTYTAHFGYSTSGCPGATPFQLLQEGCWLPAVVNWYSIPIGPFFLFGIILGDIDMALYLKNRNAILAMMVFSVGVGMLGYALPAVFSELAYVVFAASIAGVIYKAWTLRS